MRHDFAHGAQLVRARMWTKLTLKHFFPDRLNSVGQQARRSLEARRTATTLAVRVV